MATAIDNTIDTLIQHMKYIKIIAREIIPLSHWRQDSNDFKKGLYQRYCDLLIVGEINGEDFDELITHSDLEKIRAQDCLERNKKRE